MRMPADLIVLPLQFDAVRLAEEASRLPERAWRSDAVPLVSAYGDPANSETAGPMRPTPWLEQCPYIRQVLIALESVIGRTRLMRSESNPIDASYYSLQRVRVHVPVATGQAFAIDTWRAHDIAPTNGIHLVIDTVGSSSLWERIERSDSDPRFVPFDENGTVELQTESINHPVVMPPAEQESLLAMLGEHLPDSEHARTLRERLLRFSRDWRALWSTHGNQAAGWRAYAALRDALDTDASALEGAMHLTNGVEAITALRQMVLAPALHPDLAHPAMAASQVRTRAPEAKPDPQAAFRSVSTNTFAEILHGFGASLIVTTYQSGRVVIVRAEDARNLHTHLRMFDSPMGVAVTPQTLAIGTRNDVRFFRNRRDLTTKLEPPGAYDACFAPSGVHITGDIRVHELAFANGELWVVNTRFSALCTLDGGSSFVPRWRPPFVTHLAPEDRCHLNGMAVIDNRVRYVTALGRTNADNGWRNEKTRGGVVMDVDSGETIVRGLSMPHSPRWYAGRFWLLESGKGTLATADLTTGAVETVAELPGFTRGLAFAGPYAFIGLSQVRESNIFGGLPLAERVPQRECGVWVVDVRTGQTVAFLKFEGAVQEIFDVQVLHGSRSPELLDLASPLVSTTYVLPETAMAEVAV